VCASGVRLYDVADAAMVLGLSHREVERMLAVGETDARTGKAEPVIDPELGQSTDSDGGGSPDGPPATYPDGDEPAGHGHGNASAQPGGSYLVPVVDADGSRWVTEAELRRCQEARETGASPDEIRSLGARDDQLPIAEAARLVGVTTRYLRGVARHHEHNRTDIDQTIAAGRQPRKAFLEAHRGTKNQWLVTREHLAQFLERRRPPAVRVAYDLTLTTEKSLGVLALLAPDDVRDVVLDSIRAGNDRAVGWLEDRAVGRIDGKPAPAEGLMVASFRHLTSRALDPFPHHHNVVMNTVRSADGTHRALDARFLYRDAHAASALATAEMRHQLSSMLGVRWRPGRKSGWEIDGISPQVIAEFSTRRSEIDDALRELEAEIGRGAHPKEIEHIVLRTRPAKNHTPADDLVAAWRHRAARHGLTAEKLQALYQGNRLHPESQQENKPEIQPEVVFALLAAPDGICAGGSLFSASDALTALVNVGVPDDTGEPQPLLVGADEMLRLTDEFLASPHVVQLTGSDEPLFTTGEMLDVQNRITLRFDKGMHQGAHMVNNAHMEAALAEHAHLTAEQRELVTGWCQSGHRFQAAIGRAGTGKTTTVAACATAWTNAGYRVVGAAVKGEAARTLASATGIECETAAWYLAHTDPEQYPLDARTVLVIDEASTLHDRALDTLMTMAADTGASVRLIGDPAQHGAIAAGGMFRVLCEHHDRDTPELTTTHRLQDPRDRAAAEALRQGNIDEAFDQLAAAGHLHVVGDDLTMYREILGRWWDAHRAGDDHPMVDRRNATRRQLNRLAHLLRQVNGELTGDLVPATGDRSFAVGERITARAPNRDLHVEGDRHAYVRNGALGTITAARCDPERPEQDMLTVAFDGIGTIDLPRSFFDLHRTRTGRAEVGIDHAYALTSYAVQGSTRSVSTSRVDATATRAETYVDITRGRDANHLYLTAATDPLDGEALPRVPPAPADIAVAERLHRSTGELTAWELAHATEAAGHDQAIGL
jgi:conjugative relaxase-like TrwC/TraI family protein